MTIMKKREYLRATKFDEETHISRDIYGDEKKLRIFFMNLNESRFNIATNAAIWKDVPSYLLEKFGVLSDALEEVVRVGMNEMSSMRFIVYSNPLSENHQKMLKERKVKGKFDVNELVNF